MPVQTAFQCIAFLMSKGANPTKLNESKQDAFDLAKQATADYPRAERLILQLLDSSTYKVEGGNIWLEPKDERKLRK